MAIYDRKHQNSDPNTEKVFSLIKKNLEEAGQGWCDDSAKTSGTEASSVFLLHISTHASLFKVTSESRMANWALASYQLSNHQVDEKD